MKKRWITRITALCMVLCVVCLGGLISTSALDDTASDGDGSITMTLKKPAKGIGLNLYEVGTYSHDTGEITLSDEFKDCKLETTKLVDSSDAQKASYALSEYALDHSVAVKVKTTVTEDGNAYFTGLAADDRVYLITQTDKFYLAYISPILLSLPYSFDAESAPVKDVTIEAKYIDDIDDRFKGSVILNKIGDDTKPLAGAHFKLERKSYYGEEPADLAKYETGTDEDGDFYWVTVSEDLVTNAKGQIVCQNLPFFQYRFIETKAPEGFVLNNTPLLFEISSASKLKLENEVYVAETGEPVVLNFVNTPEESSKPESSKPSTPESSVQSSTPSSTPSVVSSKPEVSQSTLFEYTGDEATKYIVIGAIVLVSLAVIILLVVLSGKKKK